MQTHPHDGRSNCRVLSSWKFRIQRHHSNLSSLTSPWISFLTPHSNGSTLGRPYLKFFSVDDLLFKYIYLYVFCSYTYSTFTLVNCSLCKLICYQCIRKLLKLVFSLFYIISIYTEGDRMYLQSTLILNDLY